MHALNWIGKHHIEVPYQTLRLPIAVIIIKSHLDEFFQYSQALLLRDAAQSKT